MKEMKKFVAALILVCWVAGAPLAFAEGGVRLPEPGFFAFFEQWLGVLLGDLIGGKPPANNSLGGPGEDPEIQLFIVPGG